MRTSVGAFKVPILSLMITIFQFRSNIDKIALHNFDELNGLTGFLAPATFSLVFALLFQDCICVVKNN